MKQKIMLDGMRVGTKLESAISGSVALDVTEAKIIKNILTVAGAVQLGFDLELSITKLSTMKLVLRQDKMNKKVWYINLSGNPLTFFEGCNIYGYPEADVLVLKSFRYCVGYTQRKSKLKFPDRVRASILNLEINMSSLEFATYTYPTVNKKKILNSWDYMYRASNSYTGDNHSSLEKLLKVVRLNTEYDSSFRLALLDNSKQRELYFMVYDKEAELLSKGLKCPADIKDRLRVEIDLTSVWFNHHGVRTLKDLVVYVANRGGWATFIKAEMQACFRRCCLLHMFQFPPEPILNNTYETGDTVVGLNSNIPKEAYLAMLDARSRIYVTNEDKRQFLLGKTKVYMSKLCIAPLADVASLNLDCGEVLL